jgi:hypothetical protein
LSVELFGDGLGFFLSLEIARFNLRPLCLEMLLVVFRRPQRLAARQQKIAGVAVAHAHGLAHLAELGHAFQQNDVHLCYFSEIAGYVEKNRAKVNPVFASRWARRPSFGRDS